MTNRTSRVGEIRCSSSDRSPANCRRMRAVCLAPTRRARTRWPSCSRLARARAEVTRPAGPGAAGVRSLLYFFQPASQRSRPAASGSTLLGRLRCPWPSSANDRSTSLRRASASRRGSSGSGWRPYRPSEAARSRRLPGAGRSSTAASRGAYRWNLSPGRSDHHSWRN